MKDERNHDHAPQDEALVPDLTNAEEARKAFIVSEILQRKY